MSIPLCLFSANTLLVTEIYHMAMALGATMVLANVAREPAEGFGALRAILGAIPGVCTGHEVCLQPPVQNISLTHL